MKPWLFALAISLSLATLIGAILLKGPQKKQKEGFQTNNSVNMGLVIGGVVLVVIFGGFFLFFYSVPKRPNAAIGRTPYFNLD
jgi:uncharacterized BrkB/YihY/UPF0761 family membrane protein